MRIAIQYKCLCTSAFSCNRCSHCYSKQIPLLSYLYMQYTIVIVQLYQVDQDIDKILSMSTSLKQIDQIMTCYQMSPCWIGPLVNVHQNLQVNDIVMGNVLKSNLPKFNVEKQYYRQQLPNMEHWTFNELSIKDTHNTWC